jgi:hypothetical protein
MRGTPCARLRTQLSGKPLAAQLEVQMRIVSLVAALMIATIHMASWASPNAATWYKEELLGENGRYYFLVVTQWINRGSHYKHTELQSLRKIDKLSNDVVEEFDLRRFESTNMIEEDRQVVHEQDSPSFDLPAYMRENQVRYPYAADWDFVKVDSVGIYVEKHGIRADIVPMAEIRPLVPGGYAPRTLVAARRTSAWPDSGLDRKVYCYLRTGNAGGDWDVAQVVVMVSREALNAPFQRGH